MRPSKDAVARKEMTMATVCPVCNAPLGESDSACPVCGFKLLGRTQAFSPITTVQSAENNASASILEEAT